MLSGHGQPPRCEYLGESRDDGRRLLDELRSKSLRVGTRVPRFRDGGPRLRDGAASIRRAMATDRLILVRHGESTWNAEQRLQGQLDPPLSAQGREQAAALAPLIASLGIPPERVICSDLTRARETAELLGVEPVAFDPRWREIDVGEWAGKTAAEIDAQSDDLTNWRGGPRTASDGETWDEFTARVSDAVDELLADPGPWLVVCHGGCIRVACARLTGADPLALGSPPNASATAFELGDRPRLNSYGALPDGGLPTGLY
jgi:broad specificity phosphatase PhoE